MNIIIELRKRIGDTDVVTDVTYMRQSVLTRVVIRFFYETWLSTDSGVAYVIPWPLFVNQECYILKCLSRQAVFENSSCEFFQSLFKVKAKGQRSTLKNKGDKFIIHDLW